MIGSSKIYLGLLFLLLIGVVGHQVLVELAIPMLDTLFFLKVVRFYFNIIAVFLYYIVLNQFLEASTIIENIGGVVFDKGPLGTPGLLNDLFIE